jgi:hypothetical protein
MGRWRWTKGELVLDPEFWQDLSGEVALVVSHDRRATIRRWLAPARMQSGLAVVGQSA